MTKRTKPENVTDSRKVRVTISLDSDLLEQCKCLADADYLSLSAWTSRVLAQELRALELDGVLPSQCERKPDK